jgi:hypothetical protein
VGVPPAPSRPCPVLLRGAAGLCVVPYVLLFGVGTRCGHH